MMSGESDADETADSLLGTMRDVCGKTPFQVHDFSSFCKLW